MGKLPIEVLEKTMLRLGGASSDRVVTRPKPGLDFAAIRMGGGFLVVSADPITGVSGNIGRYAINVSANDVATSGNRPQFAETVVLMPEGSSAKDVAAMARQIHEAARAIGVAVVGGHTEVTPGFARPILAVTVFSYVKSYVSSDGARSGDSIMMTKEAGLEGTAEIAFERGLVPSGVGEETLRRAQGFVSKVSVVEEAVAAFRTGKVHAMHDCTEGGVLGAVYEMSLASRMGFLMRERSVPVAPETAAICRSISIDPLRLIGSGSLLLAVEPGSEAMVERALQGICRVTKIGELTKGKRVLLKRNGSESHLTEAPLDELWAVLGRPSSAR